jgi:glycosyltransferase involved in cell wall biosynthesis
MPNAKIVFWFEGEKMRLDGGGQRIVAWQRALTSLGFDNEVVGLWSIGGGVSRGARLSAVKRAFVPMPFVRKLPDRAIDADLVVATVPAVFGDALSRVPRPQLILDWMDLWSVNARNVGDAKLRSTPGGRVQSRLWARRERSLVANAGSNVFAGYDDYEQVCDVASGRAAWVPNPVPAQPSVRKSGPIRTIGFIGNLDYAPNRVSLREFLEEYATFLTRNQIELRVAGFGSDIVRAWGFPATVLGPVDSVDDFYAQIDAAVVPIRHGGGIKVKAVEALSFDLPVFGTDHVKSGLSPDFRSLILPLEMLKDRSGIIAPVGGAQAAVRARFSQEAFTESVSTELDRLRTL